LYLILYNLLFITPLVVVFALAYGGVASDQFSAWSKKNFGITRIALSVLFLVLAVLMGVEWFSI
jgi:cytochrome c biogenesis protein CcdA